MYRTVQVELKLSSAESAFVEHQGRAANNLVNCTHFEVRQKHFSKSPRVEFFDNNDFYRTVFKIQSVKDVSYALLCKEMQNNINYKLLGGQCAQQTLKSVSESYSGYNKLLTLWFKGEIEKPSLPKYRKSGGLCGFSYPAQAVSLDIENGTCRLPISRELKELIKDELGLEEIRINGAVGFKRLN